MLFLVSLELLLFLNSCRDEAVHGEEDGDGGEGNVPSREAFVKAEVCTGKHHSPQLKRGGMEEGRE